MTADLAGFLLAQLDADETVARAATEGPWYLDPGSGDYVWVGNRADGRPHGLYAIVHMTGDHMDDLTSRAQRRALADAAHIALHDPAFELDRIAALRTVVQQALNVIASFGDWDADAAKANGGRVLWIDVNRRERAHAHATLDALAQPYRGRAGWRDEWGTG